MPLTNVIKQKIKLAYEAGRQPKRSANENVTLKFGGGGLVYLVRNGTTSPAGAYYTELSGRDLCSTYDPEQVPFRIGRKEYIETSSGNKIGAHI